MGRNGLYKSEAGGKGMFENEKGSGLCGSEEIRVRSRKKDYSTSEGSFRSINTI